MDKYYTRKEIDKMYGKYGFFSKPLNWILIDKLKYASGIKAFDSINDSSNPITYLELIPQNILLITLNKGFTSYNIPVDINNIESIRIEDVEHKVWFIMFKISNPEGNFYPTLAVADKNKKDVLKYLEQHFAGKIFYYEPEEIETTADTKDLITQLEKLQKLKDKGTITNEEFETLKNKLL